MSDVVSRTMRVFAERRLDDGKAEVIALIDTWARSWRDCDEDFATCEKHRVPHQLLADTEAALNSAHRVLCDASIALHFADIAASPRHQMAELMQRPTSSENSHP